MPEGAEATIILVLHGTLVSLLPPEDILPKVQPMTMRLKLECQSALNGVGTGQGLWISHIIS